MSFELPKSQPVVLIVDDQATARFLASETLLGAGFRVLEAEDGKTALEQIEINKPDVVLLDLVMPDMDGYTVCQKIRANTSSFRLPVLMVTGINDEESIEQSYNAGATDFIAKPFKRYVLIQRVLALLRAFRIEEDLHRLAYFDSLTALANRTSFHQQLQKSLPAARNNHQLLSVLYLDLDDFKRINDTLGHEVGDALLKTVASRLQESIRERRVTTRSLANASVDMVARLGGDEFIILLPDIKHKDHAAQVAKRICNAVSQPMNLSGYDIFITCSIGIALFPDDSNDFDTILKHADNAMYAAKSVGKNNFRFYDESMDSAALQRLAIDSELRHALERDEFLVNYQPQIDAYTGQICGLEALLRWNNTALGAVSPAEFIPVAEDNGLIVKIGEWVLRTVCGQTHQWILAGLSVRRVSVNISVAQFTQPEFAQLISDILSETKLEPKLLELEITESLLAKNVDMAINTLTALKSVGVQLSIDDFGTGYSSLSYLKRFPIDRLKIDRSFVNEINSNADDAAIATAITSMAKSMDLAVIAEGVETEAQLTTLLNCGCREIQGYYFSRPLSTEDTTEFLSGDAGQNRKNIKSGESRPAVLFVDQHQIVLRELEAIMQENYFKVYTAADAKTAFEILATELIDVLVVDYALPDMLGAELLRQVQKRFPEITPIMLSGQTDTQSLIEVVNGCNIFRFLEKPANSDTLLTALDDAISLRVSSTNQKAA